MPKTSSTFKKLLWITLFLIAATAMIGSATYLTLSPKLPDVRTFRDFKLQTPLRIYSQDQQLIGEFGEKKRNPLHFEDIPEGFIKALLAAEDDRFFEHGGVNINGILRAVFDLVTTGEKGSGGSTITMQVARAVFLSRDRVFIRKFNEIILSLEMEMALSKEEILEMYVNEVFLGHRAYGFEAAAHVYYGKPLSKLNHAQWAMLAGLPKAPSAYNPIVNRPRATIRRDWIINRMRDLRFISKDEYQAAINFKDDSRKHDTPLDVYAPYASEMARLVLLDMFGEQIYTDGFIAHTTIKSNLQTRASRAVKDGLLDYDSRHGYRGPEAVLQKPDDPIDETALIIENADIEDDEELLTIDEQPLTPDAETPSGHRKIWVDYLRRARTMDGIKPAVVTAIDEYGADLLLDNEQTARLAWENGLSDARPYINVDTRGPKPKSVSDVLQVGYAIRVKQAEDGRWHLSQIPAAQAALVSMDPNNGAILAVSGGFDFAQSKFNRVTQAARQPGSNLKPFIYAAALENGFTAASIFNDAPVVFDDKVLESTWRPENDSGKFAGPTRLREALYSSRNLVSIRLLQQLGINNAIDYLTRFGFERGKLPQDLSLALGTLAVSPLQVVQSYATFANGGFKIEPYIIARIESFEGGTIYEHTPLIACDECEKNKSIKLSDEERTARELNKELGISLNSGETKTKYAERIMDERVNYIMTDILSDTIKKGTGKRARALERSDIAGKTGTTNGPTDVWFSGYNESIVTTTWIGFDDNSNLGSREFGSNAALPMWMDFMEVALPTTPEKRRKQPDGLVTIRIDPDTGEAAKAGQSNAMFEIFREENAPVTRREEGGKGSKNTLEITPAELF